MSSLSALSASRQVPCPASNNDSILCGRLTVQRGESGGIVKATPERVLLRRKLAEHIQPQLTRPPVAAPGAAAGCVADGRAFAERVGERGEGRLVSRDQEVSFVGAGKGTTLGGNEREEPDQHGPDGGYHGKKSRQSVDGTTGRVWLQSELMTIGRENVVFRGQRATFISNFCTDCQYCGGFQLKRYYHLLVRLSYRGQATNRLLLVLWYSRSNCLPVTQTPPFKELLSRITQHNRPF
jgi:hypothetical protein